jgi:hypothetical protein
MLRDAGVAPREATRAAQYALRGLAGADLVGYSSRREAWIVCESKGTLGDAPDPAVIRTFLPDPWIPPNGRRGRPGTTLSQPHRAMRQKRQTAGAVQALGIGKVESYAVLTSVGTETNQNPTVVDFIDPEAPRDIATVLSRNTTVVRELVAQAHFAWISDLFHLDLPLWGADADTLLRYDEAQRLQADVVVPVDDGALAFRLAFDAAIYPALASRSVALLDEYSSRQPQHPDGLSVSLIDGPEALADEADQVTLDEAYREQ